MLPHGRVGTRRMAASTLVLGLVLLGCGAPTKPADIQSSATATSLPPPAEPEVAPPAPGEVSPAAVIPLPEGAAEGAIVEPESGVLVVALRAPDRIALVDLRTRGVRTLPAPGAARHLALGAAGEILLLAENTDLLARMSVTGDPARRQIEVGRQPHDAVQVGETVFVSNEFGGSVGVVRDGRMIRELGGLVQPGGITAAGGRVAAVDVRGNRLHVFDEASLRRVAVLPAGQGPSHARPLGGGTIAVADTRGNSVMTFQISGEPRRLGSVPLPGRAYGLATDPARGWVYVTLANTNQVVGLQARADGTLAVRKILPTVRQPNDVAVDPRSGTVYVVGAQRSEVQVIQAEEFAS